MSLRYSQSPLMELLPRTTSLHRFSKGRNRTGTKSEALPPTADRISEIGIIPSLSTIIREKSSGNPFGWSWQPE